MPKLTLETLARQLRAITERLDALDRPPDRPAPVAAKPGADFALAETLAARRGAPYEAGKQRGAVAYGGGLEIGGRMYMWQIERPVPGLLALDPASYTHVLASLAHPQRWRLLVALIEAPRTSAELQAVIGSPSPGPLYHHLRELLALGVVVQHERSYSVPARHVVPILVAIALAIDLGAREATPPPPPSEPKRRAKRR